MLTPKEFERALAPCPFAAGSRARIETYRLRVELGIDLQQPGDSPVVKDPSNHSDWWRRHHKHQRPAPGIRAYEVITTAKYFELKPTTIPS